MTTIPAPTSSPLDRFFAALHRSSLTRSPNGAIGGVCSGIADKFGFSVKAVRIATVLLAIVGAATPLYLLAWLLLPSRTGTIHLQRAIRERQLGSIALMIATVLSILPDVHVRHEHHHGPWGFLLVLGIAAFVITRSRRHRAQAGSAQPGMPTQRRRDDGPQDTRPSDGRPF